MRLTILVRIGMTTPGAPYGLCASVPPQRAGDAIAELGDAGVREPRWRVQQADSRVLIPVKDPDRVRALLEEASIVEAPLEPNPRHPPLERVHDLLSDTLDDDQLDALPTGWTRLGEVLVLRLPDELADHGEPVGQAYAEALDTRAAIHLEASRGKLREPETRHLWGDPDTETVHREHGLLFHLDPTEVMFSPGNKAERHRLTDRVDGDHVVDLFAGIGYFTLPLARAGATVTACEVNPTAAGYLATNVEANGLTDRVEIREGDCRDVAPEDGADRVHMGYLPGTDAFLETARDCLRPEGGVLHYHDAAPRPDPLDAARRTVAEHPALAGLQTTIRQARVVKTLDPSRAHVVLDVEVRP